MNKYEKLDAAIMNKMGTHAQSLSEIYVRNVCRECELIASAESETRVIDPLHVFNQRLQELCKAGKIRPDGNGWRRVVRAQAA